MLRKTPAVRRGYIFAEVVRHALGISPKAFVETIRADWGEDALINVDGVPYIKAEVARELLDLAALTLKWRRLGLLDALLDIEEIQIRLRHKDTEFSKRVLEEFEKELEKMVGD